ncbi:MAG: hypothetical protein FWC09_07375 [Lachnospiraceae bacterium]|nr:hypothetical protein [Lachnospiraceae bacterium]
MDKSTKINPDFSVDNSVKMCYAKIAVNKADSLGEPHRGTRKAYGEASLPARI